MPSATLYASGVTVTVVTPAEGPGAMFYVAPTGNNTNPGTLASPWATWQYAVDQVNPGDTINIFPGLYRPTGNTNACRIQRSGTPEQPITLQGYGGRPILDASGCAITNDTHGIWLDHAQYWNVQRLDVTLAPQKSNGYVGIGVILTDAHHNTFTNVRSYANQGTGFEVGAGSVCRDNVFRQCDAFDNYDPKTSPLGGNADGFGFVSLLAGSTGNTADGCRAWNNSDDGFDLWSAEAPVTIQNCWAVLNGHHGGNGVGFKLGANTTGPRHRVLNNRALSNKTAGFDTNGANGPIDVLNNTAVGNGVKGIILSPGADGTTVINHYLRNNISFGGTSATPHLTGDQANNSWNLPAPTLATLDDFLSTNTDLTKLPRNADGSLPAILQSLVLRLLPTSDLRLTGVDVGLPFNGSAPDLGASDLATDLFR